MNLQKKIRKKKTTKKNNTIITTNAGEDEPIKTDSKIKEKFLNDEKTLNNLVEHFKQKEGNHNTLIGQYTSILINIGLNKEEIQKYMERILEKADDLTNEHTKQVESYIESHDGTNPNLKKIFKSENNSELTKKIKNNLSNYFKDIKKENDKINKEIYYILLSNTFGFKEEQKDNILKNINKIKAISDKYFYPNPEIKTAKHTIFSILVDSLTDIFNIKKKKHN